MDPSQIREEILAQRRRTRQILDEARSVAQIVHERRREESLLLHRIAATLEEELEALYDLEEEILEPTLREIDAWGRERAHLLADYLRRQREVVQVASREALAGRLPAWRAAAEILELLDHIEEGLAESERTYLNRELLRDDLVSIGQSDG